MQVRPRHAPTRQRSSLRRVRDLRYLVGMQLADANLYLVGFAGTGKTTVGRMVARQCGRRFLDSDHEIERAAGRPVSEIFAAEGEPAFRALERQFIESGHPASGCVVACGGGLIIPDGMLELVQSRGVVVCLHAPVETILERTGRATHRPLFPAEDREQRVRDLYTRREPVYRRAGTVVLTTARPLKDIVAHVVRVYQREAREFAARSRSR
jgi:shikimate kinase